MLPKMIWADPRVIRDAGKVCIMRGPVVYCAESVDNGENLHRLSIPSKFHCTESKSAEFGLPTLEITAFEKAPYKNSLYSSKAPAKSEIKVKLVPYNVFANRGESNMLVWFTED